MIIPFSLLELEEYDNSADEQDEKIKCLSEMLKNILPEYVGV